MKSKTQAQTTEGKASELSKPIISIIVPVYNVEKYVGECLDSILSQTFAEFEVIAVDDHSTDGSLSILHDYAAKDSRIIVVEHETNQKQGIARNTGMGVSSGRYTTFIDPDDYYYSNDALQIMVDTMDSTDACIVQFPVLRLLPNGSFVDSDHNPDKKVYLRDEAFQGLHHPDKYIQGYACSKIYKTSLFDNPQVVFPTGTMEDSVFVARVLAITKKVVVIDDHLYIYRIRKGSTTQKKYHKHEITAFFKNTFTLMSLVIHRGKKSSINHDYALKFYASRYIFQLHNAIRSIKGSPQEVIDVIEDVRGSMPPETSQLIRKMTNHDLTGEAWHYNAINIIGKAIKNGQQMNRDLADYIYGMHPVEDAKLRRSYKIYSTLLLSKATRPLSSLYREAFITPKRLKAVKAAHQSLSDENPLSKNRELKS